MNEVLSMGFFRKIKDSPGELQCHVSLRSEVIGSYC